MRVLKHADTPEPGRWHTINRARISDWRKKVRDDLATKRGTRYEFDTARTQGLETAESAGTDAAVMEAPRQEKPREALETIGVLAREMLEWARSDPQKFMGRVQMLKNAGAMGHLTDEEAAREIHALCEKVARADTERVFAKHGLNKAARL